MARLASRLTHLEGMNAPPSLRPVLLLGPDDDELEALADWQERYGPCDAEPLYIYLVGL